MMAGARISRKAKQEQAAVAQKPAFANKRFRVAGYVRYSADDRRHKGDSIATQKLMIQSYLDENSDMALHSFYIDNAKSGTSFDRPAFNKMLEDAENGVIDCIVTKDLSRLGRNSIDAGFYIERRFPELGIRFISIADEFDSAVDSIGISIALKNIVNEAYALDISRKCRMVQRQNMLDGKFVGRLAPYGYQKSAEDCHKLVVDETTSPVVRQIFGWAKDGDSPNTIARRLNEQRVLPPSADRQVRGILMDDTPVFRHWSRTTLVEMLADRVYTGDMVQGKSVRGVNGRQAVAPEDWIVVENTHEAIIDRELFAAVQANMRKTGEETRAARNPKIPFAPSVFKGKVYCGHCGHAMRRARQNKDGVYWFRCVSQNKFSPDACVQVSIKEEDMRAGAAAMLRQYAQTLLGERAKLCRREQMQASDEARREAEIVSINRETAECQNKLRSLFESMADGEISPEKFGHAKEDNQRRMEELTRRVVELQALAGRVDSMAKECQTLAGCMQNTKCKYDLTTELLDRYVERILVWHDKSFTIEWKFRNPFEEGEVQQWAV